MQIMYAMLDAVNIADEIGGKKEFVSMTIFIHSPATLNQIQ
jgi:hypothetical protein